MIKVIEQTTNERYNELEEKYKQFIDLYHNTNLSTTEIRKQLGIVYNGQHYKYIWNRLKKEEVSSYERGVLIRKGEWV